MAVLRNAQDAAKRMRRAFGVAKREDLTQNEQTAYDKVNNELASRNMTLKEYDANIGDRLMETINSFKFEIKYLEKLAEEKDPKAVELLEKRTASHAEAKEKEKIYLKAQEEAKKAETEYQKLIDDKNAALKSYDDAYAKISDKNEKRKAEIENTEKNRVDELEKKKAAALAKKQELEKIKENLSDNLKVAEQSYNSAKASGLDAEFVMGLLAGISTVSDKQDANLMELNKTDALLKALEEEISNKSEYNKAIEENNKQFEKDKKALNKSTDEFVKREEKIAEKADSHKALLDAANQAKNDYLASDSIFTENHKIAAAYANTIGNQRKEAIVKEYQDVKEYRKVAPLLSATPKQTAEPIKMGIEALNEVYQEYKSTHSGFARLFKWVSFLSVAKDYKAFDALRTEYMSYSGVKVDDVNRYLDTSGREILGKLKTAYDNPEALEPPKPIEVTQNELGEEKINSANEIERIPTKENTVDKELEQYSNICDI